MLHELNENIVIMMICFALYFFSARKMICWLIVSWGDEKFITCDKQQGCMQELVQDEAPKQFRKQKLH